MARKRIIITGGGPAGLMAADVLSVAHEVHLYEKEKNIGQKFLVAGKGGLNITNNFRESALTGRYTPAGFMDEALADFSPEDLRGWLAGMGISTFTGSSGKVFTDKDLPAIDILNRIREKLLRQGVQFHTEHTFTGFDENNAITFRHQDQSICIKADYLVFALGGASWPVTGSDGTWRAVFESMGVSTRPFQSSNCGINISWPEGIRKSHAGKPLKNIRLFTADRETKGEAIITEYGLEGTAVYALVPVLRDMLQARIPATLSLDLKLFNTVEQLLRKASASQITSKEYASFFHLNTAGLAVIKAFTDKDTYLSPEGFIRSMKGLQLPVDSLRPVEEAISTIGGICTGEVDRCFSLKRYPWIYVTGEMVDWDAPTGGFLLQGCFSMGHLAARSILEQARDR